MCIHHLGDEKVLPGNSFNEALLNFLNRRYEYVNINRGNSGLVLFATLFSYYLHIVITIAKYTCYRVLKRVSKLSTYRLQIFLLKYNYVKTKAYVERLKTCSQICACDSCNLGTHQLILKGGALWNLYGARIFFLKVFNKPM